MAWPAEEVQLLEHYLVKQPAPDERIEIALATLTAIYVNVHMEKGVPQKSARDFLPYLEPWKEVSSDVDQEVLRALMK